MSACRRRRKSLPQMRSKRTDIVWQIKACKIGKTLRMRDDLLDKMQVKIVTFKFGNKKWIADHRTGLVKQIHDNGEYSLSCELRAGDVFVWGESNWFCTFGEEFIVDMEQYMDYNVKSPPKKPYLWETDRKKAREALASKTKDIAANMREYDLKECDTVSKANKQSMTAADVKDLCDNDKELCDNDKQACENKMFEYDEDLCENKSHADYFIKRELQNNVIKTTCYLSRKLQIGDVIRGPSDGKKKNNGLWIVSKNYILRRTYLKNYIIRDDININFYQIFDVGDNLHYSTYCYGYVLVKKYVDPNYILGRIRQWNEARLQQDSESNVSEHEK